jgi:hypothetical protein
MELILETFISWSGQRSKLVAEALRNWLPKVIQSARPWMSAEDIDAGARWLTDVSGTLNQAKVGIICVTPENQHNPWLLFEAGALSKTLEQTRVCPLAFEMSPGQIKGPLSQFQANELNRIGIGKVLKTINESVGVERIIHASALDEIIDVWWPKLEEQLRQIPPETAPTPVRGVSDQLEELLVLSRENLRRENLRLEASKERDEKAEQMIQLMERAGLAMNNVDKNAKLMQGMLGTLNTITGEIVAENPSMLTEAQHQFQSQLLSMVSSSAPVADMQTMTKMVREMHEKDKLRTADMLTPTDVNKADDKE